MRALPPDRTRSTASAAQYLTFTLGTEQLAVPIEAVREVTEYAGITRIPRSASCVPGVLNLRGAVVPVVDLSVRLGRAPTVLGRRTCVIIVEVESDEARHPVGVLVDAVSEAVDVAAEQVEPPPAFGAGVRGEFVSAMLNLGHAFVMVLDMRAILSTRELEQLVAEAADAPVAVPRRVLGSA